jgi:hypothetical protein
MTMTEFETAFEESRHLITAGEATVEDCLARYPEHAEALAGVLQAALALEAAPDPALDSRTKARLRARLTTHTRTHPRHRQGLAGWLGLLHRPRWSAALAGLLLVLVLATTTLAAQAAEPGDTLYPWRRATEWIELVISPQPDITAVGIAKHRLTDLLSAQPNSRGYTQASEAYRDWIGLLDRRGLVNRRTQDPLEAQLDQLRSAGIPAKELELALRQAGGPTPLPTEALPDSTSTPGSLLPTLSPSLRDRNGLGLPMPTTPQGSVGSP